MPDLMESFGNNPPNFNNDIWSIGTDICEHGKDLDNFLSHLFVTYADCSLDNGTFTRYIKMLENKYNDGTLNLEYKDIIDK